MLKAIATSFSLLNCAPEGALPSLNSTFIKYNQGWWAQEATGRWMKEQQADLILSLPYALAHSESHQYRLRLEGDFFRGKPKAVKLLVNGQDTGPVAIAADGVISTSFEIDTGKRDVRLSLTLIGTSLKSPQELGLSQDDRTLTYFLKSAVITAA